MVDNMISISSFIAGLYIPLFHDISLLLHDTTVMFLATSILLFVVTMIFKQKRTVLPIILLSVLLSALFAHGAKMIYQVERPCTTDKIACPDTYSFPSSHAAVGFSLLLPSIGTPAFWIYFIYSIILAFSRLYLGLHTFFDVAGSFGIALIGYTIAKYIIVRMELVAHEIRI